MNRDSIGQPERVTQNRVVALFRDELGYRYLGDKLDDDNEQHRRRVAYRVAGKMWSHASAD